MIATGFGLEQDELARSIAALDSIIDGEAAATWLVKQGQSAVPYLAKFLLSGRPRSIALPRVRAVRALRDLHACSTLLAYFRDYTRPADAVVLFAEDAVRSEAAIALLDWKTSEVFDVLLKAARQRATSGLVSALGDFKRPEAIPLLFQLLEDDLCREQAKQSLRKIAKPAAAFAMLAVRGHAPIVFAGPYALRRRRATLQLLHEFAVSKQDWQELRSFLREADAEVLIQTASIGLATAPREELTTILEALLSFTGTLNWLQELDMTMLLDRYSTVARAVARRIARSRVKQGEHLNWLSPSWRILKHVLGPELEEFRHGAA